MQLLRSGQISNFEGVIGGMPARSEPENLAGAVGFEPTPSALTVRCPTGWTTPQQIQKRLIETIKDNRWPQIAQVRDEKSSFRLLGRRLFSGPFFGRKVRFGPGAPAAVHRDGVRV